MLNNINNNNQYFKLQTKINFTGITNLSLYTIGYNKKTTVQK